MVKRTVDAPGESQAGGPLASHLKKMYLDFQPPKGTSLWSMMWDELTVASILDPSVIKKSETMYLDVDIDHGPKVRTHRDLEEAGRCSAISFCPTAALTLLIARNGFLTWRRPRSFIPPACRWKWT